MVGSMTRHCWHLALIEEFAGCGFYARNNLRLDANAPLAKGTYAVAISSG